jgi:hypothetical protein
MKLNKLLENSLLTESYEDLHFVKSELFDDLGNGIYDYAITLTDTITGVTYAVDCKINMKDKKFKVDKIDIQDSSYATPRVTQGNDITFEVVSEFIKNNIKEIVSKAIKEK